MRLGLGIGITNVAALGGGTPAPEPVYASDTTSLTDRTSSWHSDPMFRSGSYLIAGYSKSDGTFGVAEHNPNTGAVVDARIILDEPTLYTSINDHFMVLPHIVQNGAHAGKLWCMTLPHGPGTTDPGNRRFYARYSDSGRTSGLVPADNGSGLDYAQNSSTMNYGQLQERSDGRITVLSVDDNASPQALRMLWTDNPAVVPTIGRKVADMTTIPAGGSPQLYANAVPDGAADHMRVFLFLHPSVPDAPLRTFRINLSTGQVLVGSTPQGSGSIYDTSGSTMLTYGNAPAINAPSGSVFTRLHDVCQFGDYQYGHAVAITHGPIGSDINAPSHAVLYCAPGDDPENAANWSQVNVGAANRAQSWDNGGTNGRRYNSDIRFLPPKAGEGIRLALIAHESGNYRIEIWSGATAGSLAIVDATAWAASPRPMRLFVNPGAGTVSAFAYGYTSYTSFTNFTPAAAQVIAFVPTAPSVTTSPSIFGTPTEGEEITPNGSQATGSPIPALTYKWQTATDTEGTGAEDISGATSASYTPVEADVGKSLRRIDTYTNSSGSASEDTGWTTAVQAAGDAFAYSSIGDFIQLDPATATLDGSSNVASLTSTTANGGTATEFTQADGTWAPGYISGPPARIDYDGVNDVLSGGSAARSFSQNRSALMLIARIEADALVGSNQLIVHVGSGSTATQQRLGLRIGSANQIQAVVRRLDGDAAVVITGPTITAGGKYLCAICANYGAPSTLSLFVNGTEYTGSVPTSGAASSDTPSIFTLIGAASGALPASSFNGKVGGVVLLAKSTGAISPAQIADALTKYDADFPVWT